MNESLSNFFNDRAAVFSDEEFRRKSLSHKISNLRLGLFILFVVLAFYLFTQQLFLYFFFAILLFLVAYIPVLKWHNQVKKDWQFNLFMKLVNQEELKRLQGKIKGFSNGEQYKDVKHPYTKDLDIFGEGSLFQYISRAKTEGGMIRIASWLCESASVDQLVRRQESIRELKEKTDFRQILQVQGQKFLITKEMEQVLLNWLKKDSFLKTHPWLQPVIIFLNTFFLAVLFLVIFGINWKWLFIPIALNFLLLGYIKKHLQKIMEITRHNTSMLKVFSDFLHVIEQETFISKQNLALKETLFSEKLPSSRQIAQLAFRFEMMEYGQNVYFYIFANLTLLWDLHWFVKIEKWKQKTNAEAEKWFNTISEFEALNSLAGNFFINPHWTFPEFSFKEFEYKVENLSHPLIFPNGVSNNFNMEGIGRTWILTGSNMSGKSTFLRTLGINAVLAFAGSPINGSAMSISLFRIFTSMRTEDSLQESTSSFYAELKRLKQLLDYIREDMPVFYLLDEILKGTNSADRHAGGKALVNQLQMTNSSGFVATHDLDLGLLQKEHPDTIFNYSFSSDVKDGELFFDYKIKEGICKSFNATELMKRIGIKMD